MTLYRRESGFYGWEARDRRIPANAKGNGAGRLTISLRTKDRKEAQRRARALDLLLERGEVEILQRLRAGEVHVSEVTQAVKDEALDDLRGSTGLDLSLGAMVDRVLTAKRATKRERTATVYQQYTGFMLERWGADRSILDISSDEMRAWLYEQKSGKRSPRGGGRSLAKPSPWAANTQVTAVMVFGYLWRLAIALELEHAERNKAKPRITRDPWAQIETRGTGSPRVAFLEPPEWAEVLRRVRGRREAALLGVCCLAGLRIREALYLRTGLDVNLAEGVIEVQGREGEYAWLPKHAHSERTVPIAGTLRALLEEHVAAGFAGERFFFRLPDHDRPINYSTVRRWAKSAFESAGLKYGREGDSLSLHSLRHTFASLLVREGWSSSLVAKLLGNTAKEVDTTYSHLAPDDLTKVVATLDRLVGG